MNSFHVWLQTAWTNLLSWFGVEEQKLASFLYPLFKNTKDLIKKDFLTDVIGGIPVVAAALSGGLASALAAAEAYILPLLAKQGVELAQTDIEILKNGLVAQAQASLVAEFCCHRSKLMRAILIAALVGALLSLSGCGCAPHVSGCFCFRCGEGDW